MEQSRQNKRATIFCWLQTVIPTYGETLNIKTMAYEQPDGFIPRLDIIEENHPLYIDQRNGITLKKAFTIIDEIIKDEHKK